MFIGDNVVAQMVESACKAGDPGSIPGSGRSPAEGNGNPLQYSCLENPMYGGAWWATVHGVVESDTTERLFFLRHMHSMAADHSLFYLSSAGRGQSSSTVA